MKIDFLIDAIITKKNPCIVGIDPEWGKIPCCYKHTYINISDVYENWAKDIIDVIVDIVPAIKPQIAFFEVLGWKGFRAYENIIDYSHKKGLMVIDDSKRNDIGNTAKAYGFAHLSSDGPINADFMTVSPFLGTDSIEPFIEICNSDKKGIFVLLKTSNRSSSEISDAVNRDGDRIVEWLANHLHSVGNTTVGKHKYSGIGAVVGATFPHEAHKLRRIMENNYFLVPGYGAQGAIAKDVIACFNDDGLGAVINASRSILFHHSSVATYDDTRKTYLKIVREQAIRMRNEIYTELKNTYTNLKY